MKIDVKNWGNEIVGSVELPDDVFAREVNDHLLLVGVVGHRQGHYHTQDENSSQRNDGPD